MPDSIEHLVRACAPQVLAALVRRHGDFDFAEDALQEAMLAALLQWPREGVPANPAGWLVRVGSRRLIDQYRSDRARTERELRDARAEPTRADETNSPVTPSGADDTVTLLVLCCHPALPRASQVALTLRAVAGLTTAQIARGFLVTEATMAQRISRAKARLREAGAHFAAPTRDELPARVDTVLEVLYLVFTEGHAVSSGEGVHDPALTGEAIRIARLLRTHLADSAGPEVRAEATGLLALMLLTEARASARTTADGRLVPLGEQDRSLWDRGLVAEGVDLLTQVLADGAVGPYQLQAAIAAVHAEAPDWASTDWLQIVVLYRTLETIAPSPMVTLNLAVAASMVHGPRTGLRMTEPLLDDPALRHTHRLFAVRAHLLEEAGDLAAARASYERAASLATSIPEQRYLNERRASLG